MNTLKVGWLVFLIVLFTVIGGGYHFYRKQTVKMRKTQADLEEIEKMQEAQAHKVELETEKAKDIETLRDLAKQQGKWWFLHDIEEQLGAEFIPLFRSIGRIKIEDQQDYTYISRKLEVEASYPEIIRLFENLERERGFSIESLKISAGVQDKTERHQASFVLSSLEIKKKFLNELLAVEKKEKRVILPMESLIVAPPWGKEQRLALRIDTVDPFIKQDVIKMFTAPVAEDEMPAILPPIDLSPRYRLEGIIKFPGSYVAIIGPDYILKEGDWLENMRIEKIDARQISLRDGDQEYFMAIPGFSGQEDEIKIEEMPEATTGQQSEFFDYIK